MRPSVGILGIGRHLPETVRRNDFWPAEVVERWRQRREKNITRPDPTLEGSTMTEGLRLTLDALRALGDDPFQGAIERRVLTDEQTTVEIETLAARDAIARAGIDPSLIDFVMSYTIAPEYINVPSAMSVHRALGLSPTCFSLSPDGVCNSFAAQMTTATALVESGRFRYGLLTQSSGLARLTPTAEPLSALVGDAATAVVVGPVTEGKGVLGFSHRTDGELSKALVLTVPGKRWYEEGRVVPVSLDSDHGRLMLFGVAERAAEVCHEVLARVGLGVDDVDFYASHQATKWFRPVTQARIGLPRARSVDTFPWAGSVSAANLPLVLSVADREGMLADGDVILTFSGGTGMTWSSLAMRWGR